MCHFGEVAEQGFLLIDSIRERIPECAISQDMIAGFPTETEEDHRDTLSLMEYVKYDFRSSKIGRASCRERV